MGPAKEPFEGADDVAGVLVGAWVDDKVGVRVFAVNCCSNFSIGEATYVAVEKGDAFVFFIFHRKLHTGVDLVETLHKVVNGSLSIRRLYPKSCKEIVDIFFNKRRKVVSFLLGDGVSFVECVSHPYVRYGDHERESDRRRVVGGVARVNVDEL